LIVFAAPVASLAQCGTKPHRISASCRTGSFGCWRITGTGWVGAMLYRGDQSSCQSAVSKCSSMICFRRDKPIASAHVKENYGRSLAESRGSVETSKEEQSEKW
jgi:hypothetical protein